MKKKICFQNKHLFLYILLILLVSAGFPEIRKTTNLSLMDSLEFLSDSPLASFVSYSDSLIEFHAEEDTENPIDFSTIDQKVFTIQIGHMPFGVYQLKVHYSTEYDTSAENSPIVQFQLEGKAYETYRVPSFSLEDYKNQTEPLFWIVSPGGADDMRIDISFSGYGDAEIESIEVCEYQPWKIGFLLTELAFLLLLAWGYARFRKYSVQKKLKCLAIAALVVFASYPALLDLTHAFSGHDYPFHIGRIASIANEIRYGHFPAFYQSDAGNGYGYNSLCMYGNIFLYIPALLHVLGYPLALSYNIYILLVNALTCALCLFCFRRIFGRERYAYFGCALYMLAAYRLTNLYLRSAVGEYTAMAFFPLVAYGVYRIYFEKEKPVFIDTLPLVAGISGLIESHVLSVEMTAVFLFLFAVIHWKRTLQKRLPLVEAVLTVAAVNAFFILPFLQNYQQELKVVSRTESSYLQKYGAYFSQLFSVFMTFSGNSENAYSMTGEMPLTIGFSLTIGILLFLAVRICQKKHLLTKAQKVRHSLALECFLYGVLSLWLSSAYFPWTDLAGKENPLLILFTSIQYPWRYLSTASFFLVLTTVYAVKELPGQKFLTSRIPGLAAKSAAGILAAAVIVAGVFFTGFMNNCAMTETSSMPGSLYMDTLYLPKGMSSLTYDTSVHCEPENAADVERDADANVSGTKVFSVSEVREDCLVTFPITYYDQLTASDADSGQEFETTKGYNKQLAVSLPEGYTGKIVISYQVPFAWKCAYAVSFAAAALLLFCFWKARRRGSMPKQTATC